jgi:hypothetical protein
MHTTATLKPLGHAEPTCDTFTAPLWTLVASLARRINARVRHAGHFTPVRVRIVIQIGNRKPAAEPYENPEFV